MMKHRNILVEQYPGIPTTDERLFWNALSRELLRCLGEINYHAANPKFIEFVDEKRFVIRATIPGTGPVILSLALIKRVENRETAFYTLKTSGTIHGLIGRKA